jgi:hypothetical protein
MSRLKDLADAANSAITDIASTIDAAAIQEQARLRILELEQ